MENDKHKEKNIESRKRREKSKRAHLRQLQKAYEWTKYKEKKLEKEVEELKLELYAKTL